MPNPPPKPVAICTDCGVFAISPADIGRPCGRPRGARRRRCEGVYLTVRPEDWMECRVCGRNGKVRLTAKSVRCRPCQGTGWEYMKASGPPDPV
jgi:hypothetical protein